MNTVIRWAAACGAAVLFAGCGGGGNGGGEDGASVSALTFAGSGDGGVGLVRGSAGATLEIHRGAAGRVEQSVYANPKTGEKLRVFHDADGLPERVVDEVTGAALTVTRGNGERVDFRSYDKSGKYVGGYAVLIAGSALSVAPVTGAPTLAGQMAGQLNGALQTGSFALLPANDAGLGAAQPLTPGAVALADALAAVGPTAGRELPLALGGIDSRAVIGGLAMGLAVGAGAGVAPGLVAGAMVAYGLQRIGLPIIDGVRDAKSIEQMSDQINTFLDRFNQGASATAVSGDSLAGLTAARVSDAVSRALDRAGDAIGSIVDRSSLPALTEQPSPVSTSVVGFGVDQSGTGYIYSGTVAPGGIVSAVGTAADGGDTIRVNGTVRGQALTGTMAGRLGAGTVAGTVGALGQCAALQQSGGQGTFSYAFDAGATSGTVSFFRDAYSIPDGFRVISSGATLYDTGGLVSGADTALLGLNGSRALFVTVNAPRSGTAWQLEIGCPR